MNASEAISNSSGIIIQLIDRIKDRQTAALVVQLQTNHFTIQQELIRLESENANLALDKRDFESKILSVKADHRQEIAALDAKHTSEMSQAKPKQQELSKEATAILKFFFENATESSDQQIARQFRMNESIASHHTDVLIKRRFIEQTRIGFGSGGCMFAISAAGRAYIVENGLA